MPVILNLIAIALILRHGVLVKRYLRENKQIKIEINHTRRMMNVVHKHNYGVDLFEHFMEEEDK